MGKNRISMEPPITGLEFAFVIQDPCGVEAIELAHEVLMLVAERDDASVIRRITRDLEALNKKYPRT